MKGASPPPRLCFLTWTASAWAATGPEPDLENVPGRFPDPRGPEVPGHIRLLGPEPQSLGPCTASMKHLLCEATSFLGQTPQSGGSRGTRRGWVSPEGGGAGGTLGPAAAPRGLRQSNPAAQPFLPLPGPAGARAGRHSGLIIVEEVQLGTWSQTASEGSAGLETEAAQAGCRLRCGSLVPGGDGPVRARLTLTPRRPSQAGRDTRGPRGTRLPGAPSR